MKKLLLVVIFLLLCLSPMNAYATESKNEETDTVTSRLKEIDIVAEEASKVTLSVHTGDIVSVVIDGTIIPEYEEETGKYVAKLPYGNYKLRVVYEGTLTYDIDIERLDINPYLSAVAVKVVEGFDAKLSVINQNAPVTFESDNTDVATVNDAGEIRAISSGSAIITAYCGSTEMTCKVKVLPNVYKSKKLTIKDTDYYVADYRVHKVCYKNGKIVITYRICNNTPLTVTKKKVSIKLIDSEGKVLLSKNLKNARCYIGPYKSHDYTISVSKKKLINLRDIKPVLNIRYSFE